MLTAQSTDLFDLKVTFSCSSKKSFLTTKQLVHKSPQNFTCGLLSGRRINTAVVVTETDENTPNITSGTQRAERKVPGTEKLSMQGGQRQQQQQQQPGANQYTGTLKNS